MAKNFKAIAQNNTVISELMTGREKLTTDDVIKRYPNGFTIDDFDIVALSNGTEYCVLTIVANDHQFYCGGKILTNIVKSWVGDDYIGDVRNEYRDSDKVTVKLEYGRTKNNNNITKVIIV